MKHPLPPASAALTEPVWLRRALIFTAILFLGFFLVLPLVLVFVSAFAKGWQVYAASVSDPMALSAIRLTLVAAFFSVVLNTLFGLSVAWAVTRFEFPGKNILITLVDLPFTISPVVSGLVFVLLFGLQGWLGPWLYDHNIHIVYATPGIILATIFVTFPFVARELIPLMQEQGPEEEEAALVLGAGGWTIFRRVTLPNIKWGLLYGVILCNARAMGEFGAVSVVSGHIRGQTNTLPLHVEILFNEYQYSAAFAAASLLAALALVTLVAKHLVEQKFSKETQTTRADAQEGPLP
jgi:sulfate transport system permease protein